MTTAAMFRIDFDGRDVNYGFGELDVSPVGCVMGPDPTGREPRVRASRRGFFDRVVNRISPAISAHSPE
jgi:hypothetical protein